MTNGTQDPSGHMGEKRGFWQRFGRRALVFLGIACAALLLYLIINIPAITVFFTNVGGHIAPLVWGAVIAYLCDPILRFYEYRLFRRIKKNGVRRGSSLTLTVVTLLGIIALVVMMILPQLIDSLTMFIANFDQYLKSLLEFLNGLIQKITGSDRFDVSTPEKLEALLDRLYRNSSGLMDRVRQWIIDLKVGASAVQLAKDFVIFLKNFVLGLFIAFYILASKEKRIAQIRKFRCAVFSEKTDRRVTSAIRLIDRSFGGYIKGTLIDSLLVAIQVFLLMTVLDISDYNLLIATFVGITNIIPVFGPFLGAIPSFLIVLISNPGNLSKCVVFLLIILVVQQIDGNIILPKILGDNTGVSPLAVLVAITLCGSLWGVGGMVIGVPLFAVVLETVRLYLEHRLSLKGEPTETAAYYPADTLADPERDMYDSRSGLRYRYEHSQLKVRVDARRKARQARRETRNKAKDNDEQS